MGLIKIQNGGNYAHAQDSAKLIRTFMGQFLKGNSMGPIQIHDGGKYAHAQDSNAYNFC